MSVLDILWITRLRWTLDRYGADYGWPVYRKKYIIPSQSLESPKHRPWLKIKRRVCTGGAAEEQSQAANKLPMSTVDQCLSATPRAVKHSALVRSSSQGIRLSCRGQDGVSFLVKKLTSPKLQSIAIEAIVGWVGVKDRRALLSRECPSPAPSQQIRMPRLRICLF